MRSIAPAVVMLAIGFVVGFLVGGRRATVDGDALNPPPSANVGAPIPVASRPVPLPLGAVGARSEPESARRANPAATAAPLVVTNRLVEDALADLPAESSRDRDGFVTGRVAFADGAPVSKAVVVIEPTKPWDLHKWSNRSTNGRPDEVDPMLVFRNSLREQAWARANRIQTETGEDGRFRIEGLGRGRDYWIFAFAAETDVTVNGNPHLCVRSGADVSFLATRTTPVAFSIRFADGAEAAAAIIDDSPRSDSTRGRKSNWSRSNPTVDLLVGERTINVWCEVRGQEFSSESIPLSVAASTSLAPQDVVLRPRLTLSGRVVAATGEVLRNYRVHAASFAGATAPDDEAIRRDGWIAYVSEGQKEFRFTPVTPSRYVVLVSSPEDLALARTIVDVVETSKDVAIELPRVLSESCVRVRVLDPDGHPITNAAVVDLSTNENAVRQGSGDYWLARGDAPESADAKASTVEPTRRYLRVTAPGFGFRYAECVPSVDRDVVVRFERPASIHVLTRNSRAAEGPPMVWLNLTPVPGVGGEGSSADALEYADFEFRDGECVREGIQPGTGTIIVLRSSARRDGTRLSRRVAFSSGVNRFVFEFPPTFKVTVESLGFPEGTQFRAMSMARPADESAEYEEAVDYVAGAAIVFEDVPPGRLRILARRGSTNFVPKETVVTSDTSVTMSLALPNSIHIDAVDLELESRGFKTGDVLVGFGEASWNSTDEIATALTTLGRTSATVSVRILRAGREQSFPVPERFLVETFAGLGLVDYDVWDDYGKWGNFGAWNSSPAWRLHRR